MNRRIPVRGLLIVLMVTGLAMQVSAGGYPVCGPPVCGPPVCVPVAVPPPCAPMPMCARPACVPVMVCAPPTCGPPVCGPPVCGPMPVCGPPVCRPMPVCGPPRCGPPPCKKPNPLAKALKGAVDFTTGLIALPFALADCIADKLSGPTMCVPQPIPCMPVMVCMPMCGPPPTISKCSGPGPAYNGPPPSRRGYGPPPSRRGYGPPPGRRFVPMRSAKLEDPKPMPQTPRLIAETTDGIFGSHW